MSETNNDATTAKRFVAGMGARILLAELLKGQEDERTGARRWLESELRGCDMKISLNPVTKSVLRQVAFSVTEDMNAFCVAAISERLARILNERIAAMVADDAAFTAAQVAGDTKEAA